MDYAATKDRLKRLQPIFSALQPLLSVTRLDAVTRILDAILQEPYVGIGVAAWDKYGTVERT